MMRFFTLCLLFAAFAASGQSDEPGLLVSQKRIALVIGNGTYQHASPLSNTINDADAISSALKSVGFDVILVKNATNRVLEEKVREFTATIEAGKYPVALCYYSGHGLQVDGENYLVPIDANPQRQTDVKWECLNAQRIIDAMESARATTKIILLDACRNNPLPKSWGKSTGSNGLAYMNAPAGTFLGFATSPNNIAYDGEGNNSPYTTAILQNLQTPGLSISDLFTRVNKTTQTLAAKEGKTQTPFFNTSLSDVFYFVPANQDSSKPPLVGVNVAAVNQNKQENSDSDFDGFPDDSDDCPKDYGTLRGCPDSDSDGVPDHKDNCPDEPGTTANNGCPVRDRDGDGVVDAVDKCPDVKGSKEWQGCPDSDGDGVPDHRDDCPDKAGVAAKKGCPGVDGPSGAETITDTIVGTFVLVKGGSFEMGSTKHDMEKPIHRVTLSDYYIGQTEVTQRQWRAVMGSDPPQLTFPGCNQCPVEQVSWYEVAEFLQKLNNLNDDVKYRLPTEAEWEYAARGGARSKGYTYAGSNTLGDVAWYDGNSLNKTHPVKSKQPNELGLYDMTGNVWEWCSDWYSSYSSDTQTNPVGATSGFRRVDRGGSWCGYPQGSRIAVRWSYTPIDRGSDLGFRLARSVNN
ncbi:MAG: SUMF1/EgtB/PvdO family nonheme iron enzyme [Saprospiraceae bacterium]|nr:SUMF1/EgtB/PvdO family nonheme iron enzyme [Saprospiraceae bacterium]